jgi:dUTPase
MNSPLVLYQLTSGAKYKPKLCDNSNGLDLPFHEDIHLEPNQILKVKLGVCVQFPTHFCGLLLNKSSAITKFNVQVYCGLIDIGYTNELQTVIQNMSNEVCILPAGTALVQLLVIPSPIPTFSLCENITYSERGSFGSTGQNFDPI